MKQFDAELEHQSASKSSKNAAECCWIGLGDLWALQSWSWF